MSEPRELLSDVRAALREGDADHAAERVLAAASDDRPWQRERTLAALARLRAPRALFARLEDALRDGADAKRRNASRSALAALAGPQGSPAALRLLHRLATRDLDADVRVLAASALGESKNPAARDPLELALCDPNPNVTAAAADALGSLGDPRSVEPLAAIARSRDPWRAVAAVVALGRIGAARALPALAEAARNPLTAAPAAGAIGEIRDPDGLAALQAPAESDDADARRAALDAAAVLLSARPAPAPDWLRRSAAADVPALTRRFVDHDDGCAAVLLGAAGTVASATALADAVSDPDRAVPATAGLGLLPPDVAAAVLLPRLESAGAAEREELLAALPAAADRATAERIAAFLADEDEEVRAVAADALARALPAAGAREIATARMDDPASRAGAALALGRLPGGACALLAPLLADDDPAVRRAAAEGIGRCPDPSVRAALAPALARETDPRVRRALAFAMGAAGGAESVAPLADLTRAEDPSTRFAAVRALGRSGEPGALAPLLEALASGDAMLEVAALSALGELGDARAADAVAERLEGENREVRRAAAAALRTIAPPGAAERLVRALEDGDWRVRLAAARTLGRVDAPGSAEALASVRAADPEPLVRRAAAQALGEG